MTVRGVRVADVAALPAFLDRCFVDYVEAPRFLPALLRWFWHSGWAAGPSLGSFGPDGAPLGVALGTPRVVRWEDQRLRVLHVGPVAVAPERRGRGLGRTLMEALAELAAGSAFDALTLTTDAEQRAHHLYRRLGFRLVEVARPRLVALTSPTVPVAAPRGGARVGGVAVEEGGPLEPVLGALCPEQVTMDHAALTTYTWPAVVRRGGAEHQVTTVQVVRVEGRAEELPRALAEVTRRASRAGAAAVYAMPGVADRLPGLVGRGRPLVYRMVLGLSPEGRRLASRVAGWDDAGPSP